MEWCCARDPFCYWLIDDKDLYGVFSRRWFGNWESIIFRLMICCFSYSCTSITNIFHILKIYTYHLRKCYAKQIMYDIKEYRYPKKSFSLNL